MLNALRLNSETFAVTPAEQSLFAQKGIAMTCREAVEPGDDLALFDALLVVSAKVPAGMISRLERCRVISRYGIGVDNIDVEEATRRHIVVTNVPDFCLSEMADHTVALLLALARKLFVMDRCTREGRWQARVQEPTRRVAGKTLGLIGFGRIAQAVARRAGALDLEVVAFDPYMNHETASKLNVGIADLDTVLCRSDFVSVHAPLTPATRHMIGERELALMKPDAYLINTARGGLIDEEALVRALRENHIAGAGLDVYENLAMFDPHPTQTDHPLFHLDNVILTPHSGGCSLEALDELKVSAASQAIALLLGDTPANVINPEALRRGAAST